MVKGAGQDPPPNNSGSSNARPRRPKHVNYLLKPLPGQARVTGAVVEKRFRELQRMGYTRAQINMAVMAAILQLVRELREDMRAHNIRFHHEEELN
ncbi:uncharacterized protein LOC113497593 [Trichoplusia ni]|uniref:Uncharacterized protein LOC113497593 n=1 Tax=Trichoplusia ni TaxID=7111 RepID=A0A7E5VXC6_TRINI|nr:uncharacterized protein LOC113497593 [Trichoplusia ni]